MQVKEAMHKGVYWVDPTTPISDIARLMKDHNIGCLPVGENDWLVGMVTERDIVCRGLANGLDLNEATARDVMSKGIFYTTESTSIDDAAALMEEHRVRRLPVIDDRKRMTGILSLGDMSHAGEQKLSGEVLNRVGARAA